MNRRMTWAPLLAICACLWAMNQLPAQAYRPFLNGSQWRVEENSFQGIGFFWWMTGKDTLINGEAYLQGLDSVTPLPLFVQEDVVERRVWIASAFDAYQKRLLYDFSLSVGDTARLTFLGFPERAFVVAHIGSVNTTAGFMPQWTLQAIDGGNPSQVVWAEGIGHDQHPFYLDYISVSDPSYHLICNYQQRVKLFDDGFGTCQSGSPPLGIGDAAVAWPGLRFDPASNVLWLDHDFVGQVRALQLYALDGRMMWGQERPGPELALPALPHGLYALRAELRDGRVLGQRLHLR